MSTRNARNQKAYRDRQREKKETMLNERSALFVDFWQSFPPGTFSVGFEPVIDADPDLKDPMRIRLRFPEELKPMIVAFAHDRGMDIETLIDRLLEEVEHRAKGKGLIPDKARHIVE